MTATVATADSTATVALERLAVHYRPPTGGRWRLIATVRGYAAALAIFDRAGDWWLRVIADEPATAPGLFDAEDV